MICLSIPSVDDLDHGHIVFKAQGKDDSSGENKAQDHVGVFSSLNLLHQVTITFVYGLY
jgi:hypothetical protein